MDLEYFVRINCAVQRRRNSRDFVRRAKLGSLYHRAERERGSRGDDGGAFESAEIAAPFPVKTLMGEKTRLRFADLRETWQRIEAKTKPICAECPVNLNKELFGCCGSIAFPITEVGEKWLMENFSPPRGASSWLARRLLETRCDGSTVDKLRGTPEALATGLEPSTKLLEPGAMPVSSSQLIEFILASKPSLAPEALFGLLLDFGATDLTEREVAEIAPLVVGEDGHQKSAKLDEIRKKLNREHEFRFHVYSSDDLSVRQFKFFFHTCYMALMHGGRVMLEA